MRDLELSRDLTIGQYVDTDSPLHRLGPATKILLFALGMTLGLASTSPLGVLFPFLAVLASLPLSRIPLSWVLRGLRPVLPLFVILALLQFVFSWSGDSSPVLFTLGPVKGTLREAWTAVLIALRSSSMIVIIGYFTAITSEAEAARGIEDVLLPLSRVGVPAHRLSLAVATSIRFLPLLLGELESIAKAQASRGADLGSSRGGPLRRARAWLPLFVPVVVRALERAELLAEAMEARGYTGEGRSRYILHETGRREIALRLVAVLVTVLILALDSGIVGPAIMPR